jgi:hypothetical protein
MTIQGRPQNTITNLEDKLHGGISQIKIYIESSHVFFKEENKKYHEVLKKQFWPEEDEHEFWEAINMIEQTGDFNPFFLNKSSFILAFAFFEKCLKDTVNAIKIKNGIKINMDDLSGQDIEKAYKYLSLIVNYDLNSLNKEWGSIRDYQKIRNALIHNFGEVPDNNKKAELLSIINKSTHLKFIQKTNEFLIIDEDYIFEFCLIIESFLMPILKNFR